MPIDMGERAEPVFDFVQAAALIGALGDADQRLRPERTSSDGRFLVFSRREAGAFNLWVWSAAERTARLPLGAIGRGADFSGRSLDRLWVVPIGTKRSLRPGVSRAVVDVPDFHRWRQHAGLGSRRACAVLSFG